MLPELNTRAALFLLEVARVTQFAFRHRYEHRTSLLVDTADRIGVSDLVYLKIQRLDSVRVLRRGFASIRSSTATRSCAVVFGGCLDLASGGHEELPRRRSDH